MLEVLLHVVMWLQKPEDVEALRRTAPVELTAAAATEHLAAARMAGTFFSLDPDLLLSVAYHESRYDESVRTPEPGHKVSCGVMTPVPGTTCSNGTVLDGYQAGAAHLQEWLKATHGNAHAALLGFAGGYRMIKACAKGKVLVERQGHDVDLCAIVDVFQYRAYMIKQMRAKVAS